MKSPSSRRVLFLLGVCWVASLFLVAGPAARAVAQELPDDGEHAEGDAGGLGEQQEQPTAADSLPSDPVLPSTWSREELDRLASRVRAGLVPLRVVLSRPEGVSFPPRPVRRGWAVQLRASGEGEGQLLVPLAFLARAHSVEVDDPRAVGCQVRVVPGESGLGLARLEIRAVALQEGELPYCPYSRPVGTLSLVPLSGDHAPPAIFSFFVLLPTGTDTPRAERLRFIGRGGKSEAFYLMHNARALASAPIVDAQGRVFALACGPSLLRPEAGLALGPRVLEEALSGRTSEGLRGYRPEGTHPSWPPPSEF